MCVFYIFCLKNPIFSIFSIFRDVASFRKDDGSTLDHTHFVARRLAFATVPLNCVMVSFFRHCTAFFSFFEIGFDFNTEFIMKIVFVLNLLSNIYLTWLDLSIEIVFLCFLFRIYYGHEWYQKVNNGGINITITNKIR